MDNKKCCIFIPLKYGVKLIGLFIFVDIIQSCVNIAHLITEADSI